MQPDELGALMDSAHEARKHAYAPYSGFDVGAALLTPSGQVFSGANVENASYGLTICAERAAIVAAVSAGQRSFAAIAVAGPESAAAAPCGACRQVLSEFSPKLHVAYTSPRGIQNTTLDRLLPDAFGPESLDESG